MTIYRVFMLGNDNHIIGTDIMDCQTDEEAMSRAPGFDGNHRAVEV